MAFASSSGATAWSRRRRQLPQDAVERPTDPARIDPGRDLQRAGVGVLDDPGGHVVREGIAVHEREEQARAHPVAEDRVHDRERPRVWMVARQGRNADAELGLRRVALAREDPRAGRERGRWLEPVDRPVAPPEGVARELDRLDVLDVAGDGDHGVSGAIGGRPELADAAGRKTADVGLLAADLATQCGRLRTSPAGRGSGRTPPDRRGSRGSPR